MATVAIAIELSCAVEVFLATALLHREQPERSDFTIQEIVNRVARENLTGNLRAGINVHASQHCVANKAPNPAKHRMLFATGKHTRRLVLPNDEAHPDRNGKIFPDAGDLPVEYLPVREWAKERFDTAADSPDFWADDPDERVRQLRSETLLVYDVPARAADGPRMGQPAGQLQALIDAKGIGVERAKGIDLTEHLRQLREGWK